MRFALKPTEPQAPGVHPRPLWSMRPQTDRQAGDAVVSNFMLHWFPAKVCKASLDWNYSFWLGTVTAALFLLLVVSGGPLLFLYVPSVERAYGSIQDPAYAVTFGSWVSGVGPPGVGGGAGRPEHRLVHPAWGPVDPRAVDRGPGDRSTDAHPLLRVARDRAAGRARRPVRVPHVARAEGRRARAGRSRRPARLAGRRRP